MKPYYESNGLTVYHGDVLKVLRELPAGIVQAAVTSPPYWFLRNYGVSGQLGFEPTPEEYVAKMAEVFREVNRVLRADGTLWLNLGDSYAGSGKGGNPDESPHKKQATNRGSEEFCKSKRLLREAGRWGGGNSPHVNGLKPKDLVGIPWRVAFALQADGWYLRSDIIWQKLNPMPESVIDRPTKSHEYIFLLTKNRRYFYDADAIKEPVASDPESWGRHSKKDPGLQSQNPRAMFGPERGGHDGTEWDDGATRNKRTVWTIATQPFPEAHFATFTEELPSLCIRAGTSERGACAGCGAPIRRLVEKRGGTIGKSWHDHTDDMGTGMTQVKHGGGVGAAKNENGENYSVKTVGWEKSCKCSTKETCPCLVMDPFHGAGTSMVVAQNLGRRYVGIELREDYIKMSLKRVRQGVML